MATAKKTEPATFTTTDQFGNEIEVPVGADGKNPVSPNNPPLKATGYISHDAYLSTQVSTGTVEAPVETKTEEKTPATPDDSTKGADTK